MNWAIPSAPAGETAPGSKPDSARSWAASSAGETFQRDAERRSASRKRTGTKSGSPAAPAAAPSPPDPSTELPAAEHGAGPPSKPKCQGSQGYGQFRSGLLPRL